MTGNRWTCNDCNTSRNVRLFVKAGLLLCPDCLEGRLIEKPRSPDDVTVREIREALDRLSVARFVMIYAFSSPDVVDYGYKVVADSDDYHGDILAAIESLRPKSKDDKDVCIVEMVKMLRAVQNRAYIDRGRLSYVLGRAECLLENSNGNTSSQAD